MSEINGNGHKPATKRTRKKYSEEGKAKALALLEANSDLEAPLTATANQLQIPDSTLLDWKNGRGVSENVRQLAEKEKRDLAILFRRATEKGLTDILDSGDRADWKAATGIATFADKFLLLSNEPTQITENRRTLSREEAEATLAEYERRFGADHALPLFREDDPELASTLVQ